MSKTIKKLKTVVLAHLIVPVALRVARQKPLELLRDDVGLGPAGPGVRAPAAPLVALGGNSIENILT